MNNDEKYAVPIAEQIPARSKGNIPAVLGDEIYSVNQSPAGGKRKASTAVRPFAIRSNRSLLIARYVAVLVGLTPQITDPASAASSVK